MNVGSLLKNSALRFPDRVALVAGERRLSYREYNRRANKLANRLVRLGVKKGEKVSLYLHNSIEWAEIYWALSKIGAVVVPVNFRIKGEELVHVVGNSETGLFFFDDTLREQVEGIKERLKEVRQFIMVGKSPAEWYTLYDALFEESSAEEPGVRVSEKDVHSICYTSGTTGFPKGAVLTNMNVLTSHFLINPVEYGLTRDDVILATTPLSQRIGWAKVVTSAGLGCKLIIMASFDAEEAMGIVERERVTNLSIVPTIARLILQTPNLEPYDTSSLKSFLVVGEAFPVELKKALGEAFPRVRLFSYFASTEAGQVTSMTHQDMSKKPDSVGIPISCVEVKIVGTEGEELETGEVGEVLVRSASPGMFSVMKEYYRSEEYTKASFIGDWLRTGDVGKFDDEGYLYLVDRKKDMIISGGYNIYSREVELVLLRHEKVSEAAVVGVPDKKWGETVKAFVVLEEGVEASPEELIEYCKRLMAGYKKPKYIEFIDALPRNDLGKVQKYKLKAS